MSHVGVNIGALTVKVAALRGDARRATVLAPSPCLVRPSGRCRENPISSAIEEALANWL